MPYASPLGPTLETERLILRPPVAEDFDGFCAFHADENAMTYLGGVLPPPVVWRNMRSMAGAWALDGFSMFSVIEKTSGDWIGRIGPLFPKDWPGREVGWGLLSRYWGKGYAREAAIASMDFVFDTLGWEDVIHSIDARNDGSAAVARSLGSYLMREARLPPPFESHVVDIWGQTRGEWRVNRTRLIGQLKRPEKRG
ncbi:GNAT family N-acetyltransferase [Asticcacaulis sp. AC466]|uniref:GNAT family N-acetyltransferase n=1 Tax=Asticcacaulis sp. AC466 TaxID=1282362 RepID=UPI0004CDEFF5